MSTQTERSEETVAPDQSPITGVIGAVSVKRVLLAYLLLAAAYIYLPILSAVAFSFNSGGLASPFVELTSEQYGELSANEGLTETIRRSVALALVMTAITMVLATAVALAYRHGFWGQHGLLFLPILGIIAPGITHGVGATLLLNEVLGLTKNLWLAVPVHVVWALPFAVIVLLAEFPPTLRENEEAARMLGARPPSRFRNVILPQIAPTLLGTAVLAFALSYNEVMRSLLLMKNQSTMPLEVSAIAADTRIQPYLFAFGSLATVFSTLLLATAGLLIAYNRQSRGSVTWIGSAVCDILGPFKDVA